MRFTRRREWISVLVDADDPPIVPVRLEGLLVGEPRLAVGVRVRFTRRREWISVLVDADTTRRSSPSDSKAYASVSRDWQWEDG
ncbi:MAG: hypothetical protein IPO40_04715 [Fibrobacteres bacterium]|nr:hypothetical protein [Fibrobacterota bacterium]